jgi:hypothetical protein
MTEGNLSEISFREGGCFAVAAVGGKFIECMIARPTPKFL